MKFIIAIGIALPIVAAIIGVVAWAVSADTGFQAPVASSLRRSDMHVDHQEEDIFQALEDRQDLEFSRHYPPPEQELKKHDFSSAEGPNQFDDNKDPLYIVHFVPSPKPKVEPSTADSDILGSTVSNQVLQKILSASKGAKPGTPQFVVFAPVPEEGESKNEAAGQLDIGTQGLNLFTKPKSPSPEIDYEYEEELRKYQELLDSSNHPPLKETSRVGQTKEKTQAEIEKYRETLKLLAQNITDNAYQLQQQQSALSSSNPLHAQSYNQQAILNQQQLPPAQQGYQQNIQGYSQNFPQGTSQSYAQQQAAQQVPSHAQQQPVQQIQGQDQYQQQYYPQESSNTNVQVYPQQQAHATDSTNPSE